MAGFIPPLIIELFKLGKLGACEPPAAGIYGYIIIFIIIYYCIMNCICSCVIWPLYIIDYIICCCIIIMGFIAGCPAGMPGIPGIPPGV